MGSFCSSQMDDILLCAELKKVVSNSLLKRKKTRSLEYRTIYKTKQNKITQKEMIYFEET